MLRAENAEVLADKARCRRKEGELSEYTQKLTDKNVNLQSEFQGCTKTGDRATDGRSKLKCS